MKRRLPPTDSELLDWMETEVISIGSHSLGWQILLCGPAGEPASEEAELFEGDDIRTVLKAAKAKQERLRA